MKRVTRSMTRNKDGENDLFSSLPVDLKAEILVKLPVKSVAKFICVSKFWSSIICSKGFTELYLARSPPRLLLTVARETMRFFHSYSQEDPSDEISITPDLGWIDAISPPVRGLICYRIGTKMLIRNNSTDQFLTLPKVKTRRKTIYHVFGYDPVNDLYKVLCMTSFLQKHGRRLVYDEHQVFTLGAKQKWRMIKCQHPHDYVHPFKGLCLNGVVYYIAMIDYRRFLISFDLSSEGFHVTKFPQDVNLPCYELVNYNGKIALTNKSCNGTLDLWVLEDASKQGWSKVSILVPSWSDFFGNGMFMFKGTISTGELIFEPCDPYTPFFFLYYDLKENIPRKVAIKGNGMKSVTEIFLDHVESPMILPKEPIVEEEGFKAQVYCLGRKMLYFGSLDQLYEGPVEAQASAKYDRRFRS